VLGSKVISSSKRATGGPADGGVLHRVILYVSALMEVKSALGVIVAAPTAGHAPLAWGNHWGGRRNGLGRGGNDQGHAGRGDDRSFYCDHWTFAAEAGGCQAECGSASSMAAAALTALAGGTLNQSLASASLALQNMLGLICDPSRTGWKSRAWQERNGRK